MNETLSANVETGAATETLATKPAGLIGMVEVVSIRGNVLSVRADLIEGLCVCTKCKGFGTNKIYDYQNPYGMAYGGLISIYHYGACPQCGGIGSWHNAS